MSVTNWIAVATGAVLGAWLRWWLSIWLNSIGQTLPYGTLFSNWLGCLIMGIALSLPLPEWLKLLLITGFLGSLTTFSSFTAEWVHALLQPKGNVWLLLLTHLTGGAAMLLLGARIVRWFQAA